MKNNKTENSLFEFNESREPDGKRRFKVSLHEIYPDRTRTNINGICYLGEYTRRNMASVIGMPICCQFADGRKSMPIGHGATGVRNQDGMPLYEDSVVVGAFDSVSIEDVEIGGQTRTVLMGSGYMYEQRYPQLIKWIEKHLSTDTLVHGSVELVGKNEFDGQIQYEPPVVTDEFRIPTDYLYSGYCLLTVPAGDEAAILFELNSNKTKGGTNMDEQTKRELCELITNACGSMRKEEEALRAEINRLECELKKRDEAIDELNAKLCKKEEDMAAREQEIQACKEAKRVCEEEMAKIANERDQFIANGLVEKLNAGIADFTDSQIAAAQTEIEAFKADPIAQQGNIDFIINKIEAAAYREMKGIQRKQAETNARKATKLFSYVDKEQPTNDSTEDDLHKIFG